MTGTCRAADRTLVAPAGSGRYTPRRVAVAARGRGRTWRAVAGFGLVAVVGCGTDEGADRAPGIVEPAAGFAQVELATFDGAPFRLADLRGRPAVVNFFASWCAPCVREMPEIEAVKATLGDRVAFVGVNVTDDEDRADALVADTGVTWTLLRDPDGVLLQAVGGRAMPTTVVLDADGGVVAARSGAITADDLREMIDGELNGSGGGG